MRLRLVVNPAAGGMARAGLVAARAALAAGPHRVELRESRSGEHVRELAAEVAGDDDCAGLVVAGGDGTVSAAADGLVGSGRPLGVLPFGSGNDFARALGLPTDPVAAARVVVGQRTRAIDLGRIDGGGAAARHFVCSAGMGLDEPALRYARAVPWLPARLRYGYGGVRALLAHRPRLVELAVDGVDWRGAAVTVVVTNTPTYGAGMRINPAARVDDGRLDVCAVGRAGRLRLLRLFPTIYAGRHVEAPEVHVFQGRVVRVSADQPILICVDGDATGLSTPVGIEAAPGAVRVFAPA